MNANLDTRILEIAKRQGRLHLADMIAAGVPLDEIHRLVQEGLLVAMGYNWYVVPPPEPATPRMLVQISKRYPTAYFCVLTALWFHGLSRREHSHVWVAIDTRLSPPRIADTAVRIVRTTGAALTIGIDEYPVDQDCIRVTNPARTIVDCFKYRNKIGAGVALDALKEFRRQRKGTSDELRGYAKALRVESVIQKEWASLI